MDHGSRTIGKHGSGRSRTAWYVHRVDRAGRSTPHDPETLAQCIDNKEPQATVPEVHVWSMAVCGCVVMSDLKEASNDWICQIQTGAVIANLDGAITMALDDDRARSAAQDKIDGVPHNFECGFGPPRGASDPRMDPWR